MLAIVGEPGIGKTALWRHAVSLARERGFTVLTTEPSEPEAQLPFAALGDLLGPLVDAVLPTLAPPRRAALEAALALADAAPSRQAIALACLDALALAGRPMLVAIDDAHWLDG